MARDMSGFADHPEDPNWSPDGYGNQAYGGEYYGKNAYDKDVDRYQALGNAAQNVAPVQINQGPANESRGLQIGALGLLRAQADGSAPSSAQILSQRANEAAAMQGASQGAGARTAGSAIAAARAGGSAAGTAALTANAANANQRAAETSRGQQQYAGATQHAEGQDIQGALSQAQLDAQQRALNEQRQQYMERQAYDTRGVQHQAAIDTERQLQARIAAQRAYDSAKTASDWRKGTAVVGTVASLGQSTGQLGTLGDTPNPPPDDTTNSDERMKMHIGSLGHLMRKR